MKQEKRTLHGEAVAWANRVLYDEMPLFAAADDSFADALVGVAEEYRVPIEALIAWLRYRVERKVWSLGAWRAWCQRYRDAADKLPPAALEPATARMCAEKPGDVALCPRCYAHVVWRIGETAWWCAKCGEVPL